MSSPLVWTRRVRLLASGASDSLWSACPVSRNNLAAGVRLAFPPSLVVQVKALACELPQRLGMPLSHLAIADIKREVIGQGLVANISGATLWRWLSTDALRPWQQRSWIFPRDPQFALKAGRILDLYERVWDGQPCNQRILSSPSMKKPAFKRAAENSPRYRQPAADQCASNMNTSVKAPARTSPLGTCIGPKSSAVASRKTVLRRWTVWWEK